MAMPSLMLPTHDGVLRRWVPSGRPPVQPAGTPSVSRTAYAAVHVVPGPPAAGDPADDAAVDWDATMAFRHHIWSCGLGVAEAMDTAQRGMGLEWAAARELIERTGAEAASVRGGAAWCAGVGTDQLVDQSAGPASVDEVVDAWREQLDVVASAGAVPVVMASRQLAAAAHGPDDYHHAYGRLLAEVPRPVLLHWLGEQFDPSLAGYWGHSDVRAAGRELVELCREHERVVAGVKVSVLDAEVEVEFRRALPPGVACLTGDDLSFPELIEGDEQGYSDALLGIFDPIAGVASAALARLDRGDASGFRSLLDATVPLSREVFRGPTQHYKVGVVFLAYLAGHQTHFRMLGGLESARSIVHLAEVLRLADAAGVLPDPELAADRMRPLLAAAGAAS